MKRFGIFPVGAALALLALAAVVPEASPSVQAPSPSVPANTPRAPFEARRRAQAYYHYSLGHLYEQLAGFTSRNEYLEQAIAEFKQALEYDPDSVYLSVRLAEAYRRAGLMRDAVAEAQAVLKADPKNLAARRLLARIYLQTLGELQPKPEQKQTLELAIEQYEAIVRLDPDDAESRLFLARLYRLNGQMEKAEATLRDYLAAQPRSEQALAALAQLYTDQGESARAIQLLTEATNEKPTAELLATLAVAYEQADDPDNAIATYRRALELDSDNVEIRRRLAQALLEASRYDEAVEELKILTRLNPEDSQSHLRLSQIYRHRGQFDQAEAYLARAEELAPDDPDVDFNRALLLEAEGKFAEAVGVLSDLVASLTRRDDAYNEQERRTRAVLLEQLGMLHRRLENFDEAVETFELMMELGEEEAARAYGQIIESLRQGRQLEEAAARARTALERFPQLAGYRLQLASVLGEMGKPEEAVELARGALNGEPGDREVHMTLVQIYERNKLYAEAERALDAAEKLSTGRQLEFVHFLRGAVYERQKKYDVAEQEFRKALAINPANALALNYLGYMFADRGVKLDESVELVKRALELEPYNGAYLDSLGWAYFRLEQLDLAEDYLRKAVARVSRDPTIHDHLGNLYEKRGRLDLAVQHWERSLAEWKRAPATEFDAEAYSRVEAKLRALRARLNKKQTSRN